jgi:hypothetical protein
MVDRIDRRAAIAWLVVAIAWLVGMGIVFEV